MAHPVTRRDLQRRLVLNAASKPLNVAVPAAVVVTALVLDALWLLPVALIAYVALGLFTFFDEDEAKRVGDRAYGRDPALLGGGGGKRIDTDKLAPPIASLVAKAHDDERRIHDSIKQADLPFTEVGTEVDGLVREMDQTAGKAQAIYSYLASQDSDQIEAQLRELKARGGPEGEVAAARKSTAAALEDQLSAQRDLQEQLDRYLAEMEHLVASLGAVHAQLMRVSVASEATGQDELAGQVRDLREQVKDLAQGMSEAYSEADSATR